MGRRLSPTGKPGAVNSQAWPYWPLLLLPLLLVSTVIQASDPLLMGVFPRRSATQTSQLFSPLAEYLSDRLNREVLLVTAKDFPSFWESVNNRRYDIVHYNQYHYIQSADKYTVISSNEEQGKGVIAGAIYVRRDSGIRTVSDLRGRTIIFGGGPDAMMSHIVPRYLLLKGGLDAGDYQAKFANNPLNSVLAVYYRQADAGGAGDVVMHLPRVKGIINDDTLDYLAVSEPLRQLPWAVRDDLPTALKAKIQALLVGLNDSAKGREVLSAARLTGMLTASDEDYNKARDIIRMVMPGKEK